MHVADDDDIELDMQYCMALRGYTVHAACMVALSALVTVEASWM